MYTNVCNQYKSMFSEKTKNATKNATKYYATTVIYR